MARKGRQREEGKIQKTQKTRESVHHRPGFSQQCLNGWERLRSKSGLRGERPVAFTGRQTEREERESERGNVYRES